MTKGGIDATAIRMPRYVDPHARYRMRIAEPTRRADVPRLPRIVGIVGWSKVVAV